MIILSEPLTDSRGRPLYGRAKEVAEAAEQRRRAEAELEQTRRDIAWMQVMGAGGPHAVLALARQHGDEGRAVRLLAAGGFDVNEITGRWRASQAPTQTSGNPSLFANDPEHDPAAMAALQSGGIAAWNAKVRELTEAREAARSQRAARGAVMWRTPSGELVVDGASVPAGISPGPDGAPQQRSLVHHDVPPLGEA